MAQTDEQSRRAFPRLDPKQIERIARCGERRQVAAGEILFEQGERNTRFFVVISGALAIVRPTECGLEDPIRVHGPGEFSGEMNVLLGMRAMVRGRMRDAGEVVALEREQLQQLVVADPDLSELLMRAFIMRRVMLIEQDKGDVALVGSAHSADTLRLREFLSRNGQPYSFLDVETRPGVKELLDRFGIRVDEIPVVVLRGETILRNPSSRELAEKIGLRAELDPSAIRDVVVIGAGPAGLATAVYAASEGLDVLVVEAEAPGGQAGASSKIENYLGFPTGISGQDLANRAYTQAAKFGANFSVACLAARLSCDSRPYSVLLDGAGPIHTRAIVIACGARYRKLPLPELPRFENAGVYYAATHIEAALCEGEEVIVVGGGNSSGQAAVFLSQRVRQVHIVVRSGQLADSMSRYLVRRIEESHNITVRLHTEITALAGDGRLERMTWHNRQSGETETRAIRHIFCMTGAEPNTVWLKGCVELDEKGFIKTGGDLPRDELQRCGWPLARAPHSLETSLPGVFAVGDARSGSVKRVAAAVGEGSACVQLIHRVLLE